MVATRELVFHLMFWSGKASFAVFIEARLTQDEAQERATSVKLARVVRREKKALGAQIARVDI